MNEATSNSSAFLPEILGIVHEGITAQAASRGITHIPGPLASEAMLLSLDRIKAMPSDKLRDLPLSGEVGQTIRTSFDSAFNELPTARKNALLSGRGFRHDRGGTAGPGDQIVNGRLVLGADRSIARWVGIGSQNSGPNSRDYSSMNGSWNSASGIPGLMPNNFKGTPFEQAGLTLPETQSLFYKYGFNKDQIVHAGQDAKALGLNPKDINTAKDFATVDRDDPNGREQRNGAYSHYSKWLKEHKDELEKEQAAAEDTTATDEQRKIHAERVKKLMQEGQQQSGMKAVDDRVKDKPEAKAAHERIKHRIEKLNGVHTELRHEIGNDAARSLLNEPEKIARARVETGEKSALDQHFRKAIAEDEHKKPAELGAGLLAAAGDISLAAESPKPKAVKIASVVKASFGHA